MKLLLASIGNYSFKPTFELCDRVAVISYPGLPRLNDFAGSVVVPASCTLVTVIDRCWDSGVWFAHKFRHNYNDAVPRRKHTLIFVHVTAFKM